MDKSAGKFESGNRWRDGSRCAGGRGSRCGCRVEVGVEMEAEVDVEA